MRSSSVLPDTGFFRNSLTPRREASITRQRSTWPVSMMIGTSGTGNTPGERTMRTSSAPLSSGISQSRMTRSGANMRIASRPAMPSAASWMFFTPILTRMLRTTFRMY